MPTLPTIQDLQRHAQGLSITASTDPSTTSVETLISESADEVTQLYEASGINPDDKPTIWRKIVVFRTLAILMKGKARGDDSAGNWYVSEAERLFKIVAQRPQQVSPSQPIGANVANYTAKVNEARRVCDMSLIGRMLKGGV